MILGICPFLSATTALQGGQDCQGANCALAIMENGKFKCCAFVEIANKEKSEDKTTSK